MIGTNIFFSSSSRSSRLSRLSRLSRSSYQTRRISTNSSANFSVYNFFSTRYGWYFFNERNKFEEFGLRDPSSQINSQFLEKMYQESLTKDETSANYTIGSWEYCLDFETMMQKNLRTNVERKVIRRPSKVLKRVGSSKWICSDHQCEQVSCVNRHIDQKYAWDIRGPNGVWYECPCPAERVEEAYSDPQIILTVESPEAATLDFIKMTYTAQAPNAPSLPVRRVCTQTKWSHSSKYIPKFSWYVRDRHELNMFDQIDPQTYKPEDYIVDSSFLENAYLNYQNTPYLKNSLNLVTFKRGQWTYDVNFNSMKQKKLSSGEEKSIIRRPVASEATDNTQTPILCLSNCARPESGMCTSVSCKYQHKFMHYCWQYRRRGNWEDYHGGSIEAQDSLEKAFCDPCNFGTNVLIEPHEEPFFLRFDTLKTIFTELSEEMFQFRRLATPSATRDTSEKLKHFTNKYIWYWYEESAQKIQAFETEKPISCRKAESLLVKEQTNFQFKCSNNVDYRLENINPLGAIIVNLSSNYRRLIYRRPVYIPLNSIDERRCEIRFQAVGTENIYYPIEWSTDLLTDDSERFHKVVVQRDSEEYKAMENLFKATSSSSVLGVIRIQNKSLWRLYYLRKLRMEEVLGKGGAREKNLFHGTSAACVDPICEQGFDHRLYGTSRGAAYGQGSYFSSTAHYSHSYSENNNCMFIAKVLVGDYCLGRSSMRRPAPKDDSQPNGLLYDTTVDSVGNPQIYVSYHNDQAYPAYIINFQ